MTEASDAPVDDVPPEPKVAILLVDDEPSNLVALEATLECLGQELVKASSGREALRHVLERDFAVILLDVQMPNMNGIEAATLIRERERSRHIPIIFLTGVVKTAEMMFKGYTTGTVDYLMKPIVTGILRAKVEVFVELAVGRQKLQREVTERMRIAAEISKLNMVLEQRNDELSAANADLETFAYSVSHDLRAPLRHIQGYVRMLEESSTEKLSDGERHYMSTINRATSRMNQLIDDLLAFSRIGRTGLRKTDLVVDTLVQDCLHSIQPDLTERAIHWVMTPLPNAQGDYNLLRQVWINLLSNAVKYTRPRSPARIEIGGTVEEKEIVYFVRDNGVGFNMAYADKLFGVFQRLHTEKEFEGTGIGLANARRIVQRHGGHTWAEAKEGEGATFYFSLPAA